MADDTAGPGALDESTENAALSDALAAEHAAVWGYGVVGAALPAAKQDLAATAENAHRDARDRLVELLAERKTDPVDEQGAYELPFPVLSETDAATLAVTLEDGVSGAYVRLLGDAAERATRELAVDALGATEVRAVAWRTRAKQQPVTNPFPGLPKS
jgi:Domain of unknown function (DUF4439)